MFERIVVHDRVAERHPEITAEDAICAWRNAIAIANRAYSPPDIYAAAGSDGKGRMLELLGIELEDGTLMIYHAMRLTRKMGKEPRLLQGGTEWNTRPRAATRSPKI